MNRLTLSALVLALAAPLQATTVNTVPSGLVKLTITAGTGSSRVASVVSFPMLQGKTTVGAPLGVVSGVTANQVTDSNAGWTPGELSTAATPTLIQFTSGTANGRTFLVSTNASFQNTATTLTIDAEDATIVDLTQIGVLPGDSYRLLECDTLGQLLGGGVAQGGASAAASDLVQIPSLTGSFSNYWYDSGTGNWRRQAVGNPLANNTAIRPDTFIVYNRLGASAIQLNMLGTVPDRARKSTVRNSGVTVLSSYFPANTTLASLGIQSLSSWTSGPSAASPTDIVQIPNAAGAFSTYWYDGTNWRRQGVGNPVSDTLVIPPGSGLVITQRGAATGALALNTNLPYGL